MDPATIVPGAPAPRYAGFWRRFFAYLIDSVLISCVSLVLCIPILIVVGVGTASGELGDEPLGYVAILLSMYFVVVSILIVLQWLYFALMESTRGATIGKMALGIVVTDMNGGRPSFGRASGRYFAKLISNLTLGLGYVIAGFSQQKQALHDMIAGCLVVHKYP